MEHTSLLNENLAHKIVQALLKDGAILPENYGQVVARVQQVTDEVRTTGLAFGGAAGLTGHDALAIVAGCANETGNYANYPHLVPVFKQGMLKIQDVIRDELIKGRCTFERVFEVAGSLLDSLRPTEYSVNAAAIQDGARNAYLMLGLASRHGFTDKRVLDAYHQGTAALQPACPAEEPSVLEERGEQLIADLEEGIASPAAEYLRSRILSGDKAKALEAMAEERMTGQDAEDLYTYCRAKWLGKRLAIVEVPSEQAEELVRKNLPSKDEFDGYGPSYLVRRGDSVVNAYAVDLAGRLWLNLGGRDRIEVKDVPQLWMVIELA